MTNGNYDELLDEIVILLSAALSLAGVKDEAIETALNVYQEEIEKIDDDAIYDYKSVCDVILRLKKTHKHLFNDCGDSSGFADKAHKDSSDF